MASAFVRLHPETGTSSCSLRLVVLTAPRRAQWWMAPAGRLARRNTRGEHPPWLAVAKARVDRWDGSRCTLGRDRDVLEANIIINGDRRDRMLRT